jgi:C-terminal processing protease CtpA/Prc
LEGNGVTPDVVAPLDRKALSAGQDPALDAALQWLKTQAGRTAVSGKVKKEGL